MIWLATHASRRYGKFAAQMNALHMVVRPEAPGSIAVCGVRPRGGWVRNEIVRLRCSRCVTKLAQGDYPAALMRLGVDSPIVRG